MKRILVVAPHPDDETLGCGGTMLRASRSGAEIVWVVVTAITEEQGFSAARVETRKREIEAVAARYGVVETVQLGFPTARLDARPISDLVGALSEVVRRTAPTDLFLPHRRDAHTDHAVVFDAGVAVSKWFRYNSVERVLTYETPSETDFDLAPDSLGFRPNVFIDISETLEDKIEIAGIYESEILPHPFPRSIEGIRALAIVRGAAAGFSAAEAFMLLRARI